MEGGAELGILDDRVLPEGGASAYRQPARPGQRNHRDITAHRNLLYRVMPHRCAADVENTQIRRNAKRL